MSRNDWLELVQLAEAQCPVIVVDLPLLSDADAAGVLRWLRRKARGEG